MSEQQTESEPRVLTDEEARSGLYLQPDETVALDISPTPGRAIYGIDIGNGVIVQGQPVAEVRFGGEETYATGRVINTFNAPGSQRDILVVQSPDSKRTFSTALVAGEMLDIGRDLEGQDMLPDTVSRDHCAVGKDESGRFIVENHNPTNLTAVIKY